MGCKTVLLNCLLFLSFIAKNINLCGVDNLVKETADLRTDLTKWKTAEQQKVDKIVKKLDAIVDTLRRIEQGVDDLKGGQKELKEGQEQMKRGQDEMKKGQEEMMKNQEEKAEDLRKRMEVLSKGQAELKDLVTSTMTETKESGISHIGNIEYVF